MLTKIYLAVLSLSVLISGFFTWYAYSWLKSIGLPAAAIAGYEYHSGLGWITLWVCTVVLLMLAAGVMWAHRSAWPLWASFAYFLVFTVLRGFFMEPSAVAFRVENGIASPTFTAIPIMAVISILGVAAITFLAQFVIIRLHKSTFESHDTSVEIEPGPIDE